jgi:glutamate dehydrogenase
VSAAEETTPGDAEPELDELLAVIDGRVGSERAEAVRDFACAYVRRLSREGSTALSVDALCAEIVGAFELACARDGAPVAVRAFNPSPGADGYQTAGSVIETNTEDLPFLVDSVTAELRARGLGIRRVRHPIVGTERGADGRIARILHPSEGIASESIMHFDLDQRLSPEELAGVEDAVRAVLGDVRRAVRDFPAMRERIDRMIELARSAAARYGEDEVEETTAFLRWLDRGGFIFLGYREYELAGGAVRAVPGSGLGILGDAGASTFANPVALDSLPAQLRDRFLEGPLLLVSKTNALSPIHRRVRMDYVGVRRVAPDGASAGEARLLGLFTTRAYAEPASQIPLLTGKLRAVVAAEDLIEGSHDYKAAVSLFESFPKHELFAAGVDDLRRAVVALLALHEDEVRLLGRRDEDGRSVSLIAAIPRERHSAALRERLRELLARRLATDTVGVHEVLAEGDHVRLHFTAHAARGDIPVVSFRELEREVRELARTWDDRAREVLVARHGEERGRILAARWLARFPDAYKAGTEPALAVHDVEGFERMTVGALPFLVALHDEGVGGARTRIGIYARGPKMELAAIMPVLQHLGLRVIEEIPVRLLGGAETWLQDFGVLGPDDRPLNVAECGERVAECITAVWRGEAESDSLNRLVVTAGLDWPRVNILRAYRRYRQRIGSRYTETFQNDVIAANPDVTGKLMRLFELRFDPTAPRDEPAEAALRDEILADLDAIASLDHDRIMRNQLGLIDATTRTNVYKAGRGAIAFKLRSPDVPAIPQPAPMCEIFVYSPELEGIHLRGGQVARGGIRWSDRMDYRTEVFGLMRAQMTKNAVIVPDGAKGGFLLKRVPEDPVARGAEVKRQYVTYISALLDLTDNLADGGCIHPAGVRVLDGEDTYLVVAADKGTATFSDTANAVAQRRGFWLGDAFASGGSSGYDHKRLGITARGAWKSVERHCRELGLDPAVDSLSVVGIGDMSGDVFGNGMLLSDRIRLIAAYDHRHVFVDPAPDPAASFAERRRLFDLPGSCWADYDPALLSTGGGVWSRSAKRIELSAQARAALGVEAEALTPSDVIRAILRAPVDLLFNGGIGTVVKASTESDADAQDRASDSIRVDAAQLRCRMVGEGGNLGFTQRARVEFAAGGGLINADFIDNAAGVGCSDHEVNLKILLDLAVRRGELAREERNALLAEVTEDVTAHVLYESFLQAQILAQEVHRSAGMMYAYEDLMAALEAEGLHDRAVEFLPTNEEMAARRRAGRGLERPELAVLVAYAKRSLTAALRVSALPDDPYLEGDLRSYFPAAVSERFGHLLGEHPLRRELIATVVANDVVDSLGSTFVSRLVAERGAEPAEVARAFVIAREVTSARARWAAVERLGASVEPAAQLELLAGVDWLVEATARWWVAGAHGADLGLTIAAAQEGFRRLAEVMPGLRSDRWRAEHETVARDLIRRGVPEPQAHEHAFQPALVHAPDVIAVAGETGRALEDVAQAFFLVGEGLQLEWLEREIDGLAATTRTQRWAVHAVADDILRARRELAQRALVESPGIDAGDAVAGFLAAREAARRRLADFTRALAAENAADLAGLSLAVRQLRALVD